MNAQHLRAIEAEEQRRSLPNFVAAAWPLVEPGRPFVPTRLFTVLCSVLEEVAYARVSLLEGSPDAIDAGVDKTRGDTLPKVRAISGNVGAIGLADRDSGRTSMITLWDSPDSMLRAPRRPISCVSGPRT